MTERSPGASRLVLSFAALGATLGGTVAMAVHDGAEATTAPTEVAGLPPLPTVATPAARARPVPVATTRSSR
jgi:hypothetical protein